MVNNESISYIRSIFITVSLFMSFVDILIGCLSVRQKTNGGRWLGSTLFSGGICSLSYLVSVLVVDYQIMSFASSLYFASITVMLFSLLAFVVHFCGIVWNKAHKIIAILFIAWGIIDFLLLLSNPFSEVALSYQYRDTGIAWYSYNRGIIFNIHLIYSYTLVILSIIFLIVRIISVPLEYRTPYIMSVVGIIFIVLLNAVFLYMPKASYLELLDFSIWGYALMGVFFYWVAFIYSSKGVAKRLKNVAFDKISQGIVLFNFQDMLVLYNERAAQMLPAKVMKKGILLENFMHELGLNYADQLESENFSLQYYGDMEEGRHPIRCDHRPMLGKSGKITASLLVFTDATLETDLMTGFHNWESFSRMIEETAELPSLQTVAVCDINGLTEINNSLGVEAGDKAISEMAQAMRLSFPGDTYFVRGQDALLVAVCYQRSETEVKACLNNLSKNCKHSFQSAVALCPRKKGGVLDAIGNANFALRTKKLLDHDSRRSSLLSSLVRAQQENDGNTEAHVKRTQALGERLGSRLNLSDKQMSSLSLLCLLHDIGKIGIPLEILNKPSKLSEPEWSIIQSHVEKGYQIAMSTPDLSSIAEEIRHHHERWDGSGYPDGLSKESIPLLSRIISVVDSYDAMVNNRIYRKALPKSKAMEELRNGAGSQFDPSIVSEFLQMMQEEDANITNTIPESAESDIEQLPDVSENKTNERHISMVECCRYILDDRTMEILSGDEEQIENMTGYSMEEIKEKHITQLDLIFEEDRTEYLRMVNECNAKKLQAIFEHRIRRKDGGTVYVFSSSRQYYDSVTRESRTEIVLADSSNSYAVRMITAEEREHAKRRLKQWESKYRRDPLTGLLSHEAYQSDVEERMLTGSTHCVFLMFDLDNFKTLNDTRGHHFGDECLIMVAQSLLNALRVDDLACRIGGDEFSAAIFFSDDLDQEAIVQRIQQIYERINLALNASGYGVGLSMGAMAEPGKWSFNEMYTRADKAMYVSKRGGKGKMTFYHDSME